MGGNVVQTMMESDAEVRRLKEELLFLNANTTIIVNRLQEMEYAIEAGNTAREDVPVSVIKKWFSYVWKGERDDTL